jgi:hypothetical protein
MAKGDVGFDDTGDEGAGVNGGNLVGANSAATLG